MSQVAISVVMPVYNAAEFVAECLDSILCQTFDNFELLIADDGSTDNTCDIISSYNDKRIKLFKREHNYIDSCNFLLENAHGKYIARTDADDLMLPNRLAIQFKFMEEHPNIDILGASAQLIGEQNGNIVRHGEVTIEDLIQNNCIVNPTTFMRNGRVKSASLKYEQDYIYAEDYMFWARAIMKGLQVFNINDIVLQYRVSSSQVSSIHSMVQNEQSKKIKKEILRWLTQKEVSWADIHPVTIPKTNNRLTVIIPFLNEKDEVALTVKSIRDTVGDSVDIIVINDQSYDQYDYRTDLRDYSVSYVYNKERLGVAKSRDLGVSLCTTPYFLLLDAHMRFYDGNWPKRLVSLLETDDRILLCCQSRFLSKDDYGVVRHSKECPDVFGAYSTFCSNKYWPDIEWNQKELQAGYDVEPIGNVLGAGYAASKRYWIYIRGLQGLRKYGCDEALMSFKVWREGGRCLLVKDVVIGHIYRKVSPFKHYMAEEISNNLLVSYLTFSQSFYCFAAAIAWHKDRNLYAESMKLLQANKQEIETLKTYLKSIYTRPFESVLQIHISRLLGNDEINKQSSLLHQVNGFIQNNPSKKVGLFEGVTGQLVWFCLYKNWSGTQDLEDTIQYYWTDICDAIKKRSLSWNFSEGIAGIGWACMYLYTRKLLDNYPKQLLCEIDQQIQEINIRKISVSYFASGAGGILAYVILRNSTGQPIWDPSFLDDLSIVSKRILEDSSSDLPSVFYAMFYLDTQKNGMEKNTYYPRFSEWLLTNQHLPKNIKYWRPTIFNGCIGAVIGLIDVACNNKNIKDV
ncbi:glycosyltransferase family 2 protein [Prevotella sp. P3-122]|uniref:glycosyltransferase family 2 protein n=1 Tax=Prevotella sp. P3-122 TaxID=2024223 RepID=UPI000B96253E|nr:glycosyltransferase [Prevotella sp. P3-122]OYP61316.1 hypothetical protein CIL02_06565 [Prevotella sp. P3-122]